MFSCLQRKTDKSQGAISNAQKADQVSKEKQDANPQVKRQKVAVFGGSFDPITNAHLNVVSEIAHSGLVDEVWIVPCGPRPDKPSLSTPGIERTMMCHLSVESVFSHNFGVKVCDIETKLPRALGTLSLMRKLAKEYPDIDFYFVVGRDLIVPMNDWDDVDYLEDPKGAGKVLVKTEKFLVMDRPGYESNEPLPPNFVPLVLPEGLTQVSMNLSSSEIRKRIANDYRLVQNGASHIDYYACVEGLVPSSVIRHIRRQKLYIPSN
eukprot:c37073_g1_i1.p1 GENE.c37073_g1_i1~~c37073_g1_i1.p1  ORF type:complete len:280 (+),score=105.80 c37073_g1_i1:50-841(+)